MRIQAAALAIWISTFGPACAGGSAPLWQDIKEKTEMAFSAAADVGETPGVCSKAIGSEAALSLARYCIAVSMATHPPCNTANRCALIVHEIRRNCPTVERGALPCENSMKPDYWIQIDQYDAN